MYLQNELVSRNRPQIRLASGSAVSTGLQAAGFGLLALAPSRDPSRLDGFSRIPAVRRALRRRAESEDEAALVEGIVHAAWILRFVGCGVVLRGRKGSVTP